MIVSDFSQDTTEPTKPETEETTTEEESTEEVSTEEPTTEEPVQPTDPVIPEEPTESGVKLSYEYSNWGSGYQYVVEVGNTGKEIDTWEIKVNKSDLTIDSSWSVNIDEKENYYVLTPFSWNSHIEKGQKISFGLQGSGNCNGNDTVFIIK